MTQFGRTTCDVPGCTEEYEVQYNVSVPSNHVERFWARINGYSICPNHNPGIVFELQKLFPDRNFPKLRSL